MKWLLLFPLNVLCSILCYLTNPIAVLFADERGELHGVWRYWQTWDDSCDVQWFVASLPRFLRYDFDKHYTPSRETNDFLASVGRDKGCVVLIDGNFTVTERIQRYLCRVLWLYRNCAYGFAFYLFGITASGADIVFYRRDSEAVICYDKTKDTWNRPWLVALDIPLVGDVHLDVMAGWKLAYSEGVPRRSMIAGRVRLGR